MSSDSSNKGISNFLKRIKKLIIAITVFVAAVVGFIKLFQGNTGLVTVILLVLGVGLLWLSSFYVYFKKKVESGQIWSRQEVGVKRPAYSERWRRIALAGIFAVPILTATGFFGWKYYQSMPSDKIIILIANFDGPDKDYGVTDTIFRQLKGLEKKYTDVDVQPLRQTITALDGSEVARVKGKDHTANIVLWGWYRKSTKMSKVTVYFEVLKGPRYLSLRQQERTLKFAVGELEGFIIHERLSGEMTYLTLLTIGLARYEAEDYDGAIARFTDALTQKAVPEQMIEPATIYFYRGNAHLHNGDYDTAIVDYDQAIRLKRDYANAYYNRGLANSIKGNYDTAIANYGQAIRLKPNKANTYYNRGLAFYFKGAYDSAIADFDRAIELNPDLAEAYYNRGLIYSEKGECDSAITDYNQSIKLKPDDDSFLNNLAWVLVLCNKEINKALELSKHSLKLKPEEPYYWDTLAEIYCRFARFSDAKTANDNARKFAKEESLLKSIEERAQKIDAKLKEEVSK